MEFLAANWGNLASVFGFAISIATLWVAQKAEEAARGARDAARQRTLVEELQEAMAKAEQVGVFLSLARWEIVWLRAQEIVSASSTVRSRWEDRLSEGSQANLLVVRQLSQTMAVAALEAMTASPSPLQINHMATAHGRILELLAAEVGRVLASSERGVSK